MKKERLPFQFKEAYKKLFSRITCSLLTSILTIFLTLLMYANDLIHRTDPLFWPIVCVAGVLIFISIFQVFNEHKKEDLYIYHEYLQKDIENKQLSKDRNDFLNMIFEARELLNLVYNFFILSKTESYIRKFREQDIIQSRIVLGNIVKEGLFQRIRSFFGQVPDEHFSIAIYLYDNEQDVLWDFVSKKDRTINPRENAGRVWHRNDISHIAFCFNHELELIHSNITERFNEFGIVNNGISVKDLKNYKSAITLPIYFRREQDKPKIVGVFCLTSDNIGTFHESNDDMTDPIYSLKILALRIITEIIADNLAILYSNNPNNIRRIETIQTQQH